MGDVAEGAAARNGFDRRCPSSLSDGTEQTDTTDRFEGQTELFALHLVLINAVQYTSRSGVPRVLVNPRQPYPNTELTTVVPRGKRRNASNDPHASTLRDCPSIPPWYNAID
eukprot:scaffold2581_cov164-Pinguiococcus_pyrenoidosus.AAC.4